MTEFFCLFLWLFGAGFFMKLTGDYKPMMLVPWPVALGMDFCRYVRKHPEPRTPDSKTKEVA